MLLKDFEQKSHGFWLAILLAAAYFLLMFGNGMLSLTHPDEVFYVQSAKEMVRHKSWLTPMIFDWPQFEKPIFFYWLLMIGIKLAGLSPFMARFWPSIFGIIGVPAVYGIAWVLFRNKRTAFLSGMVLAASFIHLAMSRAVLTDMTFSILTVLSFGSFCWAYYERKYKNIGIILRCGNYSFEPPSKIHVLLCKLSEGAILVFYIFHKDRVSDLHKTPTIAVGVAV